MCPPVGYEYTHSYRSLLHLADRIAQAGMPALRFDYHGTGTSPGDWSDPGLIETWVGNTQDAMALLQRLTGQTPSLVGLRLGAAIGAAAASRSPIENFVAWAPVTSGRRYVREWRALARMAGASNGGASDAAYTEAGGFILTTEAAAACSALDLGVLPLHMRGRALIVQRDDLSASPDLTRALAAQSIPVEEIEVPGYLRMMDEPHNTEVPLEAIAKVASWLSDNAAGAPLYDLDSAGYRSVTVCQTGDPEATETLVQVPGTPSLFGVLTAPPPSGLREVPLLLLSNSGSVHQVGPNRLYVELARSLASAGVASFRMDLRNLGDSTELGTPYENHPYPPTAVEDIGRSIDWLNEDMGYDRIVVGGVCSGAYHAFQAGLLLPHTCLARAIMVNPLTFRWREGLSLEIPPAYQTIKDASYYGGALRDPDKWLRLLRGQSNLGNIAAVAVRRGKARVREFWNDSLEGLRFREPSRLSLELQQVAASGRHMDFVFSESDPGYGILVSEARRTVRTLRRRKSLSVTVIPQADHTFSLRQWRSDLASVMQSRLVEPLPSPDQRARR